MCGRTLTVSVKGLFYDNVASCIDLMIQNVTILLGSTSAFDCPGEGSARPRIIRGFRPEVYSDEEDFDEDKKLVRRVSFTEAKER